MAYWFNFNGIDSRNMGVLLIDPVPVMRGKERVSHPPVPGRAGLITLTEGENIYEPYVQTVKFAAIGADGAERVMRWLRGRGYVTFHTEAHRRQRASIENEIKLERVSKHIDKYQGIVQFYCDPMKEPLAQSTMELNMGRFVNEGDADEKPRLFISGASETTITVDGREFTLTGIPADGCMVDCLAGEVLSASGEPITRISRGEFPRFTPGENNVEWTQPNGSINITMERRVIYL